MFALMEKAGEQMNVPEAKIDAFIDSGWKVIEKFPGTETSEAVQTPEGEATPAEAVEKVSKRKAKS